MTDRRQDENPTMKELLRPGPECLSVEQLEAVLEGSATDPQCSGMLAHIAACQRCEMEAELLTQFRSASPKPEEAADVAWIVGRLRARHSDLRGEPQGSTSARAPWWRMLFPPLVMRTWLVATASLLILVGGVLYVRRIPGPLVAPDASGDSVIRGAAQLSLISPVGELSDPPAEFRWSEISAAATYEVRLLEVDLNVLWKTTVRNGRVALPPGVQQRIAPGKTLLWQVEAWDASGKSLASSALTRFRVAIRGGL